MTTTLNPKSTVPTLEFPLIGGGKYSVLDSSTKNFLILVVYRGYHCPKCKAQLKEIEPIVADYKDKGFDIVAVSMDSEERAQKTVDEWGLKDLRIGYGLPLPIAKEYGLFISDAISEKEPKYFSEPGIFVIRPDGALYAEYLQNTPFGRPPLQDILDGLEFVIENDYPTRGTSVA